LQLSIFSNRIWLIFYLAVIVFYLAGLGSIPLLGPDEPRYAQVAREMYERGDWVTPTLGGYTWFEKPALLYWFQILFYNIFGVSEFSARLGSALSGLITALMLYWLGNKVSSLKFQVPSPKSQVPSLGFLNCLIFATSIGAIVFSRAASFDIILTMPVAVSLCFFFASDIETDEKKKRWFLALYWAFMGVALLAKGLIAIIICGGVVFWYFAIQRRLPEKKTLLSLLWGVPLCLGVASAWYAPAIMQNGWKFVDEFFIQHHFARYTSNKYMHPQPFYFFILVAPLLVFPWTPFLIQAIWKTKNIEWRKIESVNDRFQLFSLVWLILPVLFFSLSGSKLPGYILPVLPAIVLLIGQHLDSSSNTKALRVSAGILLLTAIGGAVYVLRKTDVSALCVFFAFASVWAASAFALTYKAKTDNEETARNQQFIIRNLYLIAFAILISFIVALNCLVPVFARRDSVRDLILAAKTRGYTNNPVLGLHTISHSAEFYAPKRLWRDNEGKQKRFEGVLEVAEISRKGKQMVLVLVPLEYLKQLTESKDVYTEIISDNTELAIVAVGAR